MTTIEKDVSGSDVSDLVEDESGSDQDSSMAPESKSANQTDHLAKWGEFELDDSIAEALVANGFKEPTEV